MAIMQYLAQKRQKLNFRYSRLQVRNMINPSLHNMIITQTSLDGFSIRAITKSFAIREFITMVFSKYYFLAVKEIK
jgi:hypothetical protein